MCRNIKPLYNFEPPTTEDEIRAAAIQFVRKISGFNKVSTTNEPAFEMAVQEVSNSAKKLLENLTTNAPPKNREIEQAKAQERNRKRFGK